MNSILLRDQNDLNGLRCVAAFGWLRAPELGRFLWPGNKSSAEAANRVIRSWAQRDLVILRELPDRAGKAVVLSAAGARLLNEQGIEAKTGKDLGVFQNGKWRPSESWRHDLIAAGLLLNLREQGWEVMPETFLKKHKNHLRKIPDGLLRAKEEDGGWIWLEVERASKTGTALQELAQALVKAARGNAEIAGRTCEGAMVAYCEGITDSRGYKLDHKSRVINAISKIIVKPVTITFARCSLQGMTVRDVELSDEEIFSARALEILGDLNRNGWIRNEHNDHEAHFRKYRAAYKYFRDRGYVWKVWYQGEPLDKVRTANSLEEAKRMCAEAIWEHVHETALK